jgi:DNA-binding transcriptional ArsR family regulator
MNEESPVPTRPEAASPKGWHRIHKALADPLRIRLVEALWESPRSARELADWLGVPADRLYYHLGQLERAGLIRVAEYQPRARGKVERVYAPAEVEPPTDAGPAATAAFLGAVLDATNLDIGAAYQAKQAGRRREVTVHRGALRLTDEALAELRGHIDRLTAQVAEHEAEGTWVRLTVALVDLQDRPETDDEPPRRPT